MSYMDHFNQLSTMEHHLGNGGATGLDSYSNYCGHRPAPEWRILYTRTRDSDVLTNTNWEVLEETFEEDEEKGISIIRIGSWACGWVEYFCISDNATSEIQNQAGEIACRLAEYPVLDEQRYCEKEHEEAEEVWANCYDEKDRIEYIRNNRSEFDFHDFADLLAVVRGKYFSGYASELIY